ncbi:MAG: permease-like cell division protein FtsX [Lachnospiraceae bacterium]|nr:permease-like cell division protein FtsX [Lachnospiraceae bacterium]
MQKISTFFYGIGQGIKNIFRNRMFSLASISTMAACLFLFGVFYIVLSNFEYLVRSAETNVGLTVFFDEGTTDERINEIRALILRRAEVHKVEYISAEEAWEEYKNTKLSPELAETFGDDNPLENSASLTVYLSDVSMQDVLSRYIKSLEGVRKLNDSAGIADSLSGMNKIITVVSAAIIIVLLLVATFLIGMTISTGVSVRKQEISIMKLIGASNYFIRIPYIVEGILIGIIGAAIPLLILRLSYSKVVGMLEEKFSTVLNVVTFLPPERVMRVLIPVSLLIGVGIGFLGSVITLRRQLRKIEVGV